MKYVIMLLLSYACIFAGYAAERRKMRITDALEDFSEMLGCLRQEIEGSRMPLPEAFEETGRFCRETAVKFTESMKVRLEQKEEQNEYEPEKIWRDCVSEIYKAGAYRSEEVEAMILAGRAFRMTREQDISEQLKLASQRIERMWRIRQAALVSEKRICRCLSVCGAIFVIILMW